MTHITTGRLAIAFTALVATASAVRGQTSGASSVTASERPFPTVNPFLGSVLSDPVSGGAAPISFADAIQRGLRFNLGLIETESASADARAIRLGALAALLPSVTARAAQVDESLSLKEFGLTLPGLPAATGGFLFGDVRVSLAQSIYSGELRNRYRSEQAADRASTLSARDARDVVVFTVGAAYLRIEASQARLATATAQLVSAQELDRVAADKVRAEVAPEIDALRARVERQGAEQRVINARNDLEKDKLMLARVIGLSVRQPLTVESPAPFRPLEGWTEQLAMDAAFRARADLASAQASIEAAELDVRAARAQQYPSVGLSADYGGGGNRTAFNQLYTVAAAVSVPLYTGGRIRADVARAEQDLRRRRAEFEDLNGQVAYDVRVAWLDLGASSTNVTVAQSSSELADRALAQAQDRYRNDVTNDLEVVEAQEAVAHAHEDLVTSLYAFNVAKLSLARAIGHAEESLKEFFTP